MRSKFLMTVTACAMFGAAPANARTADNAASNVSSARDVAAVTTAKPVKMVCKSIERTGSHVRERVCLSKAEWARLEKHMEESF